MHPIAFDGSECILVPSSTPQPQMQAPTHTLHQGLSQRSSYQSARVAGCSFSAASLQLLWQKRRYLLCRYDSCTDTPAVSGNHLVSFRFTGRTHSATCVRRTHLGVENDPTIKIRCRRSLLNTTRVARSCCTSQPANRTQRCRLHSQWFRHCCLNIFIDLTHTSECVKVHTDCV